jgi:HEAT repeat protein
MPRLLGGKKTWLAILALLGCLGVAAWVERGPILTWYYLGKMEKADAENQEVWADRVAGLDGIALPSLLKRLHSNDEPVCQRVGVCLAHLTHRWSIGDARTSSLVVVLAKEFAAYSARGRAAALIGARAAVAGLGEVPATSFGTALTALLRQASRDTDEAVRGNALRLAEALPQKMPEETADACFELARGCMKDTSAENRSHAVCTASHLGNRLSGPIVQALGDEAPEVRREAVRAAGRVDEWISTEDLLNWLHDSDAGVRHACEEALRQNRKLKEHHLELGRLLTDPRAAMRVRVVDMLPSVTDLDVGVWLRRLSHDPSPAVRAAAVRVVNEIAFADLVDRIDQMAHDDPSATVRQLAQYYLAAQKPE